LELVSFFLRMGSEMIGLMMAYRYVPFGFYRDWKLAVLPVAVGGKLLATAVEAMGKDGHKVDRKMYKLWCLWMIAFFPLPLLKRVLN
jgi:hypothetical protein